MITFIIVLLFNLYWLKKYGITVYLDAYKWSKAKWVSVMMWSVNIWAVSWLIYSILRSN